MEDLQYQKRHFVIASLPALGRDDCKKDEVIQ